MKAFRFLLSVIFLTLFVGCGHSPATPSSYKDQPQLGFMYSNFVKLYYPGDVHSFDTVGVISMDPTVSIESVKDSKGNLIEAIQIFGKRGVYPTGMNQHHFLPGVYTFDLSYSFYQNGYSARSTSNVTIQMNVQSGAAVHLQALLEGGSWTVAQRDSSADMDQIQADFISAIKTRIK